MKYLMLDTNIYIDMVVSRNKSYNTETYEALKKLLDYGEIKLLIPNVVITEVFRHIDNEINKVGRLVTDMKREVKDLYWINYAEQLEKFNANLKPIKSGLNVLVSEFSANNDNYKLQYKQLFNELFNHENAIVLHENENIVFKAMQRSIYKKRPFHYNARDIDKDSSADAIIIESLINIDELIDNINESDKIYFISRNPVDFSDDADRNLLHDDIRCSLEDKGMSDRVKYSTLFSKTLSDEFKDEIESVGLTQELEAEAENEANEQYEEINNMEEDDNREMAGLPALSTDFEEVISDLDEVRDLFQFINDMDNEIYAKCEEFDDKYYSLEENIENSNLGKLQGILDNNQILKAVISSYENEEDIKDNLKGFVTFMVGDEEYSNFGEEEFNYDDSFSLNTSILNFKDYSGNIYRLDIVGYINPSSGDSDDIDLYLYKNNTVIKEGNINIYYGYIEFDDDGNVGDGAQDDISVDIDNIISKLIDIKDDIISNLQLKISQLEELNDNFI
ncbi:hypothetical protein FDB42_10235 [Clostridium botulinum]|nr:hypothetical protein [Clostridium botulinum]